MAFPSTSMVRNSKATVVRKPSSKAKVGGVIENTFTVQEAYIYELLNNKLDIFRKEAELNYEALKTEIANNREVLKAEIGNNYEVLKAEIGNNYEVLKAEIGNNYEVLKAEIASNYEVLKAEIASNRELFLTHFKNVENRFKSMERQFAIVHWVLGLTFTLVMGIMTKLLFF